MHLPQEFKESAGLRLCALFVPFFFLLLLSAVISAGLQYSGLFPEKVVLLASSATQCLLAFCLPAWLAARFSSNRPEDFLSLDRHVSWQPFAGIVIVYILALPALNQIISWNESVHFPEWASEMENLLRKWEKDNGDVAVRMLTGNTFPEMLAALCVVGVLTGFSEELFFRGGMQRIFVDSGISRNASVWIVAAIFSAMHFQFFGFFPRLLMGVFFGYLLVWTRSLWPSVAAHALNNSAVVAGMWLYGDGTPGGIDTIGVARDGMFPWDTVWSILATWVFFRYFRKYFFQTRDID